MNCDEFRAQYLAGENNAATAAHLNHCSACRSRRRDLEAGRIALMDPATWEEPPPELENQVIGLISGNRKTARTRLGRVERWVRPVAAAAAVVIAAGVYGLVRTPAPDWRIAMPGTDLAPRATSTVAGWNTESGTRMVVTIEGLDAAPAGYVYEFWLSQGPLHISAGTFSGGGEIDLWTGVARADFPRLWVTLEPLDDDEAPSRQTVLDTGA